MCDRRKSIFTLGLFCILLFTVFSCKKNTFSFPYLDLSNSVEYLEAPPEFHVGDITRIEKNFKPLEKKDMGNLLNLLENEDNYLWLRIRFDIPKELRTTDLGLFIGYIHSADRAWLNMASTRTYGSFPPNVIGAGYQAQYFMFPRNIIKQRETNTFLIQVWTGFSVSMSDQIFIAPQMHVARIAERRTFLNSKIYLCAACIMLLVSILYLFLYVKMKRFDEYLSYLFFGLLVFYSVGFLSPFFLAEVSWIKPIFITYFDVVKWFMCFGAYTAMYFASSFIINWLKYKDSTRVIVIRLLLWVIPLIGTLAIPSFKQVKVYIPYYFTLILLQFLFCVPKVFKAFRDHTRRLLAIQCVCGFLPVILGLIADVIIRILLKNRNYPFFSLYGWQITIYIFLFYLMNRFSYMFVHSTSLKEQLTEFNAHLEDVVALRTKELSEANFMLSRGLESVSNVQKNFLPKQERSFRGWEIAVAYRALDNNVSGDLYDYYYTNQKLDGVGIFDVSGHGISAGLMTVLAKSIISQSFINGQQQNLPISQVLYEINDSYIKEKSNVENYITGLLFRFGVFDKYDSCLVDIGNAGHPAPLLYSKKTNEIAEIKYEDPAKQYGILGVEGLPVSFPDVQCKMGVNDILVCFTDGLTEASNAASDEFGKKRLAEVIKANADRSAEEIKAAITAAYKDFIGNEKLFDDITLIILKRTLSKDYLEEI